MGNLHKQLGQSAPVAATLTTLYTVPALTKTQVYSISVCNTSNTDDSFRVLFVPSGGPSDKTNAIFWDIVVTANDGFSLNCPQIIEAGGLLRVQSTNGNITFTASGIEIT